MSDKEITQDRIDAITIDQWQKWAEKYSATVFMNGESCYIEKYYREKKPFTHTLIHLRSFFRPNGEDKLFDLLGIKGCNFKKFDFMGRAKAIHELIDEVEAM